MNNLMLLIMNDSIALFTLERDSYKIILFFMTEDEYILYVSTGNQDLADTEADVSCNLIGEWGSTGSRLLAKSTNQVPFKMGQVSRMLLIALLVDAV